MNLTNVFVYFLDVKRSGICCLFGSMRGPVDDNCVSTNHIPVRLVVEVAGQRD